MYLALESLLDLSSFASQAFSHNIQITGCLHTRTHHPPFPQKVMMGTAHKNLGLLGHKNQKKKRKKRQTSDL